MAKKFNGEIISADSRQVYKGLDLGTGKITKKEMRGVPHYLLDVASPKRVFTASDFAELAKHAIEKISKKGKLPIICGGTGFYIAAALEKQTLAPVPPNKKLRKELAGKTAKELFEILRKMSPEAASNIDIKNPHRLIRAIEVIKELGSLPKRERQEEYRTLKLGILFPQQELKERIILRLKKRLRAGLVGEIKKLHAKGLSWQRMESLGLEYRYVSRSVRGLISEKEMEEELAREIIRYSKRQMTWFKKDKNIRWLRRGKGAEAPVRSFLKASIAQ